MSEIEAINASSLSKNKNTGEDAIKPETKKKLESLGIDAEASKIKTETEAQKKIKEVESAQANQPVQQVNNQNPMQEQIRTDANKLAETIGVKVQNIGSLDELFDKMDKTIKGFEKEVKNDTDNERREMVTIVRQEFEKIHAQYLSVQADAQKLTGSLNGMAMYNIIRS